MVEEAGRQVLLLPGDLATEAGCKAAVQATVDKFGRIDILVGAPHHRRPFATTCSQAAWSAVL